jgi:hypothetical protein
MGLSLDGVNRSYWRSAVLAKALAQSSQVGLSSNGADLSTSDFTALD